MEALRKQRKIFLYSILIWGIGMGCFGASLNNFIINLYHINATQRGLFEFMRELPGVLLVFILALLNRFSDWNILRIGTIISMVAVATLLVPLPWASVVILLTMWSLGEHVVMPVRQSIALNLAEEGKGGESLGIVTAAINVGTVSGSIFVFLLFYFGINRLGISNERFLYNIVWCTIIVLLMVSVALTYTKGAPNVYGKRPKMYFAKKYKLFYLLELFYGARKQIFLTFAPFVLIKEFGMSTSSIALLLGISALITAVFGGKLIGRLTDKWGYRNVMIWDTIILFFVCVCYGYAKDWFSLKVATIVVCINYILDTLISNASIATNLYAKTLSSTQEELTATLSTGISVNHIISVLYAIIGGFIYDAWGPGVLFTMAAFVALLNSAVACMVKKPE